MIKRFESLMRFYCCEVANFAELAKFSGKVILLMHERQFRKGKLNNDGEVDKFDRTELNKLGELIDYFKNINADFKTLDEY